MRRAAGIVAVSFVAACGLGVTGVAPEDVTTNDAGVDATTSSSSGGVADASTPTDAADAAPDAAPCAVARPTKAPVAHRRTAAMKHDGYADDWPCAFRYAFDYNEPLGGNNGRITAFKTEVGLTWDASGYYAMAEVFTTAKPAGNDGTAWKNDAAEFYLGLGKKDGGFTNQDLMVDIDYAKRTVQHQGDNQNITIPGLTFEVSTTDHSFVVEVFFPRLLLDDREPAVGQIVRWDVQIDEHEVGGNRPAFWMYGLDRGPKEPHETVSIWAPMKLVE